MVATLLLLKYCLLGGGSIVALERPSKTCTSLGEVEELASGGLDYEPSLSRLLLKPTTLSSTAITTLVEIGSILGSP